MAATYKLQPFKKDACLGHTTSRQRLEAREKEEGCGMTGGSAYACSTIPWILEIDQDNSYIDMNLLGKGVGVEGLLHRTD